jgi:hypothetical protein
MIEPSKSQVDVTYSRMQTFFPVFHERNSTVNQMWFTKNLRIANRAKIGDNAINDNFKYVIVGKMIIRKIWQWRNKSILKRNNQNQLISIGTLQNTHEIPFRRFYKAVEGKISKNNIILLPNISPLQYDRNSKSFISERLFQFLFWPRINSLEINCLLALQLKMKLMHQQFCSFNKRYGFPLNKFKK